MANYLLNQTGAEVQAILDAVQAGYLFRGVATPATDPGTPDQRIFYLAGPGTYTDFSGLVVPDGSLGILKYDGSWSLETIAGLGGGGGDFVQVTDTGLYFVDENLNIGAYLDATGFHAPNILEFETVNL